MSLVVVVSACLKMLVCLIGGIPQWRRHASGVTWGIRVICNLCTPLRPNRVRFFPCA